MIEQLRPIPPEPAPTTPLCDALIPTSVPGRHEYTWRRERYGKRDPGRDPDKCQHHSVVKIGMYCYCKKHAGQVALQMWLDGKLIEKESADGRRSEQVRSKQVSGSQDTGTG